MTKTSPATRRAHTQTRAPGLPRLSGRLHSLLMTAFTCAVSQAACDKPVAPDVAFIEPSTVSLRLRPGSSETMLTAKPLGPRGNPVRGVAVTWSSSDTSVVKVTPVDPTHASVRAAFVEGKASIRASAGGRDTTISVVVQGVVDGVSIAPRGDSIRPTWQRRFVASVAGDPGVRTDVQWRSSQTAIAVVDSLGTVTARAVGSTMITATAVADPGKSDSVSLKVMDPCDLPYVTSVGAPSLSIRLDPGSCRGVSERVGYTLATQTAFQVTSRAQSFYFDLYPLAMPAGRYATGGTTTSGTAVGFVIAAPGSYQTEIEAASVGSSGDFSIELTPWTPRDGKCPRIVTTTGVHDSVDVTWLCEQTSAPDSVSGQSFYARRLYVLPPLSSSETLTVAASATAGITPRIQLYDTLDNKLAETSATSLRKASVTYVAPPGPPLLVVVRLTSVFDSETGRVTFDIVGPAAGACAACKSAAWRGATHVRHGAPTVGAFAHMWLRGEERWAFPQSQLRTRRSSSLSSSVTVRSTP